MFSLSLLFVSSSLCLFFLLSSLFFLFTLTIHNSLFTLSLCLFFFSLLSLFSSPFTTCPVKCIAGYFMGFLLLSFFSSQFTTCPVKCIAGYLAGETMYFYFTGLHGIYFSLLPFPRHSVTLLFCYFITSSSKLKHSRIYLFSALSHESISIK